MLLVLSCYLLVTPGYLTVSSCYLVVTSGYLIVTTGYFSLLLVTSRYFWFLVLATTSLRLITHRMPFYEQAKISQKIKRCL